MRKEMREALNQPERRKEWRMDLKLAPMVRRVRFEKNQLSSQQIFNSINSVTCRQLKNIVLLVYLHIGVNPRKSAPPRRAETMISFKTSVPGLTPFVDCCCGSFCFLGPAIVLLRWSMGNDICLLHFVYNGLANLDNCALKMTAIEPGYRR